MKHEALIIFGLVAISLAAFSGLGQCRFINFDDDGYIINNPHVTSGLSAANFSWAWKTFEQGNYLPLTWISLMLDATLFGSGPHGFHWVNLAFHTANAVLVFLFFRHATGAIWRSALVAAIFAVHPLRVESVAWIVERKDVLTGFLGLLTMLAYLRYTRGLKWNWYAATLLLFAATLLAKQVLATLPFVLLLMDYWPLGRWDRGPLPAGSHDRPRRGWRRLFLEKIPFLVLAMAILTITIRAQASDRAIVGFQSVPLKWRLANVPVSYARYLGKMAWFGNLAVVYPRRAWSVVDVTGSCLLLAVVTAISLWKRRSSPWLIVGWLWFLGVLIPMIGIVQFGPQAMADRFTYISGIGLSLMVAWSIPVGAWKKPVLVVASVGTTLSLLILFTIVQTRYWRNSIALFDHNIRVAGSDNSLAEANLGIALTESDELPQAIDHLRQAEKLNPKHAQTQNALALALAYSRHNAEALEHAAAAVRLEPDNAKFHVTRGYILRQNRQYKEAANECRAAIGLDPDSAEAHNNLGVALCELKEFAEGLNEIKAALAIKPELKSAQVHLRRYQNLEKQSH